MANTVTINDASLKEYINVHKDELLVKASATFATMPHIEVMYGVKYKDEVPVLESEIKFKSGEGCGWNPDGSDTIKPVVIETVPLEVDKEFCQRDMRKTFANYQLAYAAGREKLPFEQKFIESNIQAISDELEKVVWQGNADPQIAGFIAQITGSSASVKVTVAGTSAIEDIDAVVEKLTPLMLKKGVNLFVSPSLYRKYVKEMNERCCAGRSVIDAASVSLSYEGDSRVTIIPVTGLEVEGKEYIVGASKDALVYGTDIEGSENEVWFDFDAKESKYLMKVLFLAGTALKWEDEIVFGSKAD